MRRLRLLKVLSWFLVPVLAQAQVNRLTNPGFGSPTPSGWNVDPGTGTLSIAIPIGGVTGEIPIPVTVTMDGTFRAPMAYNGSLQYINGNTIYVAGPEGAYPQPIFATCGFGFIGSGNSALYGMQNGGYGAYVALEDGRTLQQTEFTTHANYGGGLLTAWQVASSTAYTVHSSGSFLWATLAEPQATPPPIAMTINSQTIGQMVQQHLPVNFGLSSTVTYHLVADKNLLRVYVEVPAQTGVSTNVGMAAIPVLWTDRFGHFVTFQWTQATTGLPGGITSLVRVDAVNQWGQGVTLRFANWSDTSNAHDQMRVDFVHYAAPAALISGYSGFASANPSGYVGTAQKTFTNNQERFTGLCCRPTQIQIGDPLTIPEPAGWNAYGPGTPPTLPLTNSGVETHTWGIQYDAAQAEISRLTTPTGVNTQFDYANDTMPNNYLYFVPTNQGAGAANIAIRGVISAVSSDQSGKAAQVRTQTWANRAFSPAWTVTFQDYWSSVGSADSVVTYSYAPADGSHWVDFFNGFLQLEVLTGSGQTWATTTYQSTTSNNGGVGGGLDNSLSIPATITTTRLNENARQVSYAYTDASDLQLQAATSQDAGVTYSVTTNTYNNSAKSMLEPTQVASTSSTRYGGGKALAPASTVINQWDQNNPPLLQLLSTYATDGSDSHGRTFTYFTPGNASNPGDNGKILTQGTYHVEGGAALPSPATLTLAYDSSTGQPTSWSTQFSEVPSGTGTMTRTATTPDGADRPTLLADEKGVQTTLQYDLYGRLTSSTTQGLAAVTTSYMVDQWTVVQNQAGLQTTSHLDGFGRLIKKDLPDGTCLTYAYDLHGRLASTTKWSNSGVGISRSTTFDLLDRPVSQTGFDGTMVTYAYAALANGDNQVTSSFNGAYPTVTETDPFGQVVKVTAPTGDITTNTYDGMGNLYSTQLAPTGNAAPQVRTFLRDSLGRLTSKTEPETGSQINNAFNALNQPTRITEAGVRSWALTYDGLGRLRNEAATDASGTVTESFTYRNLAQTGPGPFLTDSSHAFSPTSGTNGYAVTQHFDYWPPAQGAFLKDEITTQAGLTSEITYGYTKLGAIGSITYPSGRQVTYGFDGIGRAIKVTSLFNGVTQVIIPTPASSPFDAWGNRSSLTFGSGAVDHWAVDATNARPGGEGIIPVTGTALGWIYTYEPATGRLNGTGEWSLANDSLGRLTAATQKWTQGTGLLTAIYLSDAFGNNTSATASDSATLPVAFNPFTVANPMPNNQLQSLTSAPTAAVTGASYDAYGQLQTLGSAVSCPVNLSMGWDAMGRLAAVSTSQTGAVETYRYAPSGQRVARFDSKAPAQNRLYACTSAGQLFGEYLSATGAVWNRDVVYLEGRAIAEIDASGLVHELSSDALGSPRIITRGATGAVEGTQAFGPYGEYLGGMGYVPLTGYSGHLQTEPNGLIYMRGRYYSPA